ncbi:cation diffusion facilitator family transporter [Pollutimonas sp. M17]|uniref:cation diffusion facilitator family transporter n=1 Tax=Pollutimonas sp. M17 TaxID=2962065 RepID=UPI0021F3CFD0|nr:cation diffusion facilitator family transporter [Pollutimonas sp. M17]UYO93101.1 cation diffusion facilitator family transporter [Pollutimonas sp. M17]
MSPHFAPDRQIAGHRSTLVSVAVNIALTAIQLVVGLFAHSQALVADAIHSLSDLVSDGVVLVANKHSQKAPDADHPYGHRRFETAASLIIGALLLSVGIGMLWSSFVKLQSPQAIPEVHSAALAVALLALASKELLFRYMLRVAKRVRSSMLVANAWHARSDAASSLVVALGILANLGGFHLADPLAALVVGLMIIRMGWRFFFRSFNDLMDSAVDDETEGRIRGYLLSTPGVHGIHGLKTRKLGDMIWVEVDLEMDGDLTITQGHAIATEARKRVMQNEPVLDVMTHFDPVHMPAGRSGESS